MPKNIKLLLTESVEAIGIVGDVVNVRTGFARNFLLPRNMATTPTEEAIKAVAAKRADAEKHLAELRKQREALIKKIEGIEVTIQRSCNDLGHLYASVTQQEIAKALEEAGHKGVKARDVRLHQNIKRIDTYDVHIKFESDLEATIKLWVVADRKLDLDKHAEAEAAAAAAGAEAAAEGATQEPAVEAGERPAKGKGDKQAKGDKPAKSGREDRGGREDKAEKSSDKKPEGGAEDKPKKKKGKEGDAAAPAAEEKKVSTWGKPVDKPSFDDLGVRRPRRDRDDKKRG
jgi:large subunit ribosomal protein L9